MSGFVWFICSSFPPNTWKQCPMYFSIPLHLRALIYTHNLVNTEWLIESENTFFEGGEKLEFSGRKDQREMSKFYFRFIEICTSSINRILMNFHYMSDITVQMRVSSDDHRSCVIRTEVDKHMINHFDIGDLIQSDQGWTWRGQPFIWDLGK